MHTRVHSRRLAASVLLAALFALATPALAHDPAAGDAVKPQEGESLGQLSFPTSTRSAPAQAAFERGMLLLHLYEYPDAATAFQQAQALDPDFAMAYWGEALTATHALWNQDNLAMGRAALAKLAPTPQARAAKAGSARERAYLDAAEKLYGDGTLQQRDNAFLQAMEAIAKAWPDDAEAQLFLAQALLGVTRGERNVDNYLRAAGIAKGVHARNPRHPGAAHYWIHGMDSPEHAGGALEAANALSKIAPAAGHAQHMVSHIYLALGMWDEVASANEQASRVVAEARTRAGLPPSPCGHYVEWLQYGYYQLGRHRDAQALLDACVREGGAAVEWLYAHPDHPGQSPEAFERRIAGSLVLMRAAAVVETATAREPNGRLPLETAALAREAGWGAFARGWAAASTDDADLARAELAHLRKIADEPPGTEEIPRMRERLDILADLLLARIAEHDGDREQAIVLAGRAAGLQDSLPVDFGPPTAVKPPHEYAGELLLAAGRADEARAEFAASLRATPRRAPSLLGLARANHALGDAEAALQAYEELADIWASADPGLADLAEVRREASAEAPGD